MGEYWKPVNMTKNQYLHPHRMGCGLKYGEWAHPESNVWRGMLALIEAGDWSAEDVIVAVSDYCGLRPIQAPLTYELSAPADDVYFDEGKADVSQKACELAKVEYQP
jgi:hypothetical protein